MQQITESLFIFEHYTHTAGNISDLSASNYHLHAWEANVVRTATPKHAYPVLSGCPTSSSRQLYRMTRHLWVSDLLGHNFLVLLSWRGGVTRCWRTCSLDTVK